MLDMGQLHERKKYLCENLGVKEGEGHLLKGGKFFRNLHHTALLFVFAVAKYCFLRNITLCTTN